MYELNIPCYLEYSCLPMDRIILYYIVYLKAAGYTNIFTNIYIFPALYDLTLEAPESEGSSAYQHIRSYGSICNMLILGLE